MKLLFIIPILLISIKSVNSNNFTVSASGCKCDFDSSRNDCACCIPEKSKQCSKFYKNSCRPLSLSEKVPDKFTCGKKLPEYIIFTQKSSGCVCDWKTANDKICACCYFGGKQCPFDLAKNRCVSSENEDLIEACVQDESSEVLVFGEISGEDDVLLKRGRGKLGKFGKNKLDKFGVNSDFEDERNRFENQELSIAGENNNNQKKNKNKEDKVR